MKKIHEFLINYFQTDDLVHTVTLAKTMEIDHNQNNIYPLVNLDLTGSNVSDQAVVFSFQITALQQRDKPNTSYDSKLLTDTNYLSNMNETHFILNRFLNVLRNQYNDSIELLSASEMKPLRNFNRQDLDGWQFTLQLQIPNIVPNC